MKQQTESRVIDMHLVVEFCTKLALQACKIVKEGFENVNIKTFMKSPTDPVTEADLKIQTMLIRGIRKVYPKIKIVGEEEVEFEGEIDTNYETLKDLKLPEKFKLSQKYHQGDVCIWIDPIDNTQGFINGHSEAVTVLIGISHKGKAEIGVIGTPYQRQGEQKAYRPSVIIACASEGHAFEIFEKERQWNQLQKPQTHHEKPVIALSPTRKNILESVIVEEIHGTKLLAGGAGYKIVLVAKGKADLLAYCDENTKKWDTCAGEAIIKALKGYFIGTKGQQIVYDPLAKNYKNFEGVICGFTEKCKEVTMSVCKKHYDANLKMNQKE